MLKFICFYLSLVVFSGQIFPNNFEDALLKGKSENKRIVVKIYTDWCVWCRKMDNEVYLDEKVKKILKSDFVVASLNAESLNEINYNGVKYTEKELAVYFGADGYPTTVFLEPDGKVIIFKYREHQLKNIPGYVNASDFRKLLRFVRKGKYRNNDLSDII